MKYLFYCFKAIRCRRVSGSGDGGGSGGGNNGGGGGGQRRPCDMLCQNAEVL